MRSWDISRSQFLQALAAALGGLPLSRHSSMLGVFIGSEGLLLPSEGGALSSAGGSSPSVGGLKLPWIVPAVCPGGNLSSDFSDMERSDVSDIERSECSDRERSDGSDRLVGSHDGGTCLDRAFCLRY